MSLLAKMMRRRPAELLMLAEALLLLAVFRMCLAVVPVRRIIGTVTRGKKGTVRGDETRTGERDLRVARRVQWAVRAAARYSVVEFVCFPQALAAYSMLRWRGVESRLVYGVARSPEGPLAGHTWVEMGDGFVVGGEESEGFVPVERWT